MNMEIKNTAGSAEIPAKEPMRRLFNRIAGKYDLLNHVLSFGADKRWRRILIRRLRAMLEGTGEEKYHILDLATGTGDVAMAVRKKIAGTEITGADLSEEMMRVAAEKVKRGKLDGITFVQADAARLPFDNEQFDAVTVSFGIRNFRELETSFREILRVLKPGGALLVLEFAWPRNMIMSWLYRMYSRIVIPGAGQLLARDREAYKYLTGSIKSFPKGKEITDKMKNCGFQSSSFRPLGVGIVNMYEALKN